MVWFCSFLSALLALSRHYGLGALGDPSWLGEVAHTLAEIAGDISLVIAERQVELAALQDKLDQESNMLRTQETRTHLLERICNFFGIESLRGRISPVSKS